MRELVITIKADGRQATTELGKVDVATDKTIAKAQKLDKAFAIDDAKMRRAFDALNNAKVDEAIKRLDSSYKSAEKSVVAFEREQTKLNTTFGITKETATKIAGGVTAAMAGLGVLSKRAVDQASEIQDAMERMGIKSAESVQRLAYAATLGGASLNSVDIAIKEMAKSLTGDKAAEQLIEDLGLNLQKLRDGAPDQTFVTLAQAVKGIANPVDQAKAALVLFGRSGTDLLPAIKAGFKEVGDQAPVMSTAVVKAGDDIGDKLQALHQRFDTVTANALLPFAAFFMDTLPTSVQVGAVGLSSFMPSLNTITLGIIAAGGPKAALASLATLFGTTIPTAVAAFVSGAGAAMVTFFTTTLPAAFGTIIAFLGPQGLIALGLLALAGIWYLFGDKITAVVQKVYGAVKTWLVDKFNSIVESVKGKIDAITGFFGEMYDSVVGHSYVPDMVTEIGQWFEKLDDVMVKPTETAASKVQSIFASLLPNLMGGFGSGGSLGGSLGAGVGGMITGKLFEAGGMLNGLANSITKKASDFLGKGIGDMVGLALPGIGSLLGPLIGKGIGKLGSWVGGLFGGKSQVNKDRDSALKQFAGIDDLDQASDKVRELGFAAGVSDQEMRSLFSAKRIEDFDRIFGSVTDQIAVFNRKTAESLQVMKDELATPVVIPVTFGMIDPGLGGSGGTDMFSPRNFGSYSDWLQNWLGRNPNDAHRANEALGGQNPWGDVPQFADGGIVPGRGARRAIVHGGEGVLNPRGMAALEAMNRGQAGTGNRGIEQRLDRLASDLRMALQRMPTDLMSAVRARG